MKKLISIIIATVSALCMLTPVSAYKIGDYIGTVYHTDIVAYINNYAVPSYAATFPHIHEESYHRLHIQTSH